MKKPIISGFVNKTPYKVGRYYELTTGTIAKLITINQAFSSMTFLPLGTNSEHFDLEITGVYRLTKELAIIREVTKELNPEYFI